MSTARVSAANAEVVETIQESPLTSLMRAYIAATDARHVDLDWDAAERVAQFGNGIPEAVSIAGSAVPRHGGNSGCRPRFSRQFGRLNFPLRAKFNEQKKPPTSGGL